MGNGLGRWNTIPTLRRTATGSTSGPYRSAPSSSTLPSTVPPGDSSCIRFSVRSSVDFPHPDGPMNAVTSRGSIARDTSATAVVAPYLACSPPISMRLAMKPSLFGCRYRLRAGARHLAIARPARFSSMTMMISVSAPVHARSMAVPFGLPACS